MRWVSLCALVRGDNPRDSAQLPATNSLLSREAGGEQVLSECAQLPPQVLKSSFLLSSGDGWTYSSSASLLTTELITLFSALI